jgi:hypothetical protein
MELTQETRNTVVEPSHGGSISCAEGQCLVVSPGVGPRAVGEVCNELHITILSRSRGLVG